jgi:hypothetical protein
MLDDMREAATIPEHARVIIELLAEQLSAVDGQIAKVETRMMACHKVNPVSQRLSTIPGVGPVIATAITATVADPAVFRSGREFAAWLGLTPTQKSTGGKQRLGRISRKGDQYIRRLLVDHWSSDCLAALESRQGQSVDSGSAGVLRPAEGRSGARQQDGSHRLGRHGERRTLSADRDGLTPAGLPTEFEILQGSVME